MKNFLFLFTFILLYACGNNTSSAPQPSPTPQLTEAESDDLLLQLATHLVAEPQNLKEEQNNTIVNFAIDNNYEVQPTSSGLYYQIIKSGEGRNIKWGDYIAAHYRGSFLDGKVFDSSYKKGKPLQFYVGNTIDGWNEGLQKAQVGSQVKLLIPGHLAYGEKGLKINDRRYLVPPNAILNFEIEVLDILPPPEG